MTDINKYYKEYYNELGDNAYKMEDWSGSSRLLFLTEYLTRNTPNGGSILDVGCGDMHMSTELTQYTWKGIDINIDKAKGDAIEQDLMKEPYKIKEGHYDSAMCSEVLEHVWDLRVVHRQVYRALKPGGFYVVSTPNFDWIDHHIANYGQLLFDSNKPHLFEHIRQYNFSVHKRYLEEAGFTVTGYTGCDAQYSAFFQGLRSTLSRYLKDTHGLDVTQGEIDCIIGTSFPLHNHTIMVTAIKKEK